MTFQKTLKKSLNGILKAPSTYILFPFAYIICQILFGLIFSWPSHWGWALFNFAMMSLGLLAYQTLLGSIKGTEPIPTKNAIQGISTIYYFLKDFVSSMVSVMAVTVVFMLIASLYMDFEASRDMLLSMSNEEFQSSIHSALRLGFIFGLIVFAGKYVSSPRAITEMVVVTANPKPASEV